MLDLLHEHNTATIATLGPLPFSETASGPSVHAATVFYAADDRFRLVFLSKGSSIHGGHIRAGGAVAVTVAGRYDDWREIQGLQLWGSAEVLRGTARAGALVTYLRRFPFVRDLLADPRMARQLRDIEVFRVTPQRASLTDNTVGLFGREVLEDLQGPGGGSVADVTGEAAVTASGVGATGSEEAVRGLVVSGKREAAGFIGIPWVRQQVAEFLGAEPFPGTLNLRVNDPRALAVWRARVASGVCLTVAPAEEGFCAASYFPVRVGPSPEGVAGEWARGDDWVEGGVIAPHVEGYPEDMLEVVAAEPLRERLGLSDGDELTVEWVT